MVAYRDCGVQASPYIYHSRPSSSTQSLHAVGSSALACIMASAGAHLTSTVEDDGIAPSIFEVLAQENLVASLRPALKYALRVLAEHNPTRFGWLYGFGDEVYTLLDLIIEQYYLKHYSASFAENFYGIKRVPVIGEELLRSHRTKSLLFLVLLPYIKDKCEQYYDRISDPQNTQQRSRLGSIFLTMYPYLHCLHEGAMFMFQMAYVFGKSSYHSPHLWLSGIRLASLTEEDVQAAVATTMRGKHSSSSSSSMWHYLQQALGMAAIGLSSGLSVAVFFIQFLEWWYASDQHAVSLTALPQPPPPKSYCENVPKLSSICPLCQRIRTNDTALSVSGYVFCYPCIYRHLEKTPSCPVTSYPATSQHLIKLFLPEQ